MPPAASPPDHLERLFQRLVANIAALDPAALHRPVKVGEIAERLVPYRTHRAVLGVDTNEDYEMTILRLLAGERGFAQVFPRDVAAAIAREAEGSNPDTGLFRQFPDATFLLDADRVVDLTGATGPAARAEPGRPASYRERDAMPAAAPATTQPDDDEAGDDDGLGQLPFSLDDSDTAQPVAVPREITPINAPCPYCGGNLPVGRTVLFCPHCGQNIGVVHCPTCGSELDVGWQFCITCGQKATGLG